MVCPVACLWAYISISCFAPAHEKASPVPAMFAILCGWQYRGGGGDFTFLDPGKILNIMTRMGLTNRVCHGQCCESGSGWIRNFFLKIGYTYNFPICFGIEIWRKREEKKRNKQHFVNFFALIVQKFSLKMIGTSWYW